MKNGPKVKQLFYISTYLKKSLYFWLFYQKSFFTFGALLEKVALFMADTVYLRFGIVEKNWNLQMGYEDEKADDD